MHIVITIAIVIASIALILVVLVQKSKGGGLASGFSSSNQILGVKRTTDTVEKMTWGLTATILALCLFSSFLLTSTHTVQKKTQVEAPAMPTGDAPDMSPLSTPEQQPTPQN